MVRETSTETFEKIRDSGLLSQKRFEVFDVMFNNQGYGPMTGGQIAKLVKTKYGNFSHSETVRNRIGELRDLGVVNEVGTGQCPITKNTCLLFELSGSLPTGRVRKESPRQKIAALEQRVAELEAENADLKERIK